MDAVLVLSPEGDGMVVSEVVVETDGGKIRAWHDSAHGAVGTGDGGYASLDDVLKRNSRSTTHAHRVKVDSVAAARAQVGKSPQASR